MEPIRTAVVVFRNEKFLNRLVPMIRMDTGAFAGQITVPAADFDGFALHQCFGDLPAGAA